MVIQRVRDSDIGKISRVVHKCEKEFARRSFMDKKFVPFLHNGDLYFIGQEKEEESDFKGTAKPAPSATSLNRELSTVSYTYAQLSAILGPYTMRRLIAQTKMESDLNRNGSKPREESQEWRNQMRTALTTLSQVDSQTLERQYKNLGPLSIRSDQNTENVSLFRDYDAIVCSFVKVWVTNKFQKVADVMDNGETFGADQIAKNSREKVEEPAKPVNPPPQGIAKAKSPARARSPSRSRSSGSSKQIRGAAGKAPSSEEVSTEEDSLELSYTSEDISDIYGTYSYSSSSLATANDPTILYPTAASCSFSADSSDWESASIRTANDGWLANGLNKSRRVNSVSTGIWLSNCSEPPSSICSAHSFSSVDVVTADLYTGDMETAEAAESEIEAANRVFDIILSAKSTNVQPARGDGTSSDEGSVMLRTAHSSSCEIPTSALKTKAKLTWLPLFDADDTRTAIEGPIQLRTAWERTITDNTAYPLTSGCGAGYCSFMGSDVGEMREIE
ncbi:hypothetical protein TELCIR_11752 [Teladorsagia circumcincta]|uniref:Uncharacterized protein n=1 Tax=Teladorsagia circumcincta TaxID=45464 RepID=A0A2G9U9X2_TELCI|nr:hypothetical protein TELCIR_11752 [Teladorsagia circumcincta]